MEQAPSISLLRKTTRDILHSINEVFVPTHISGHKGGDPVAIKKLLKVEGTWFTKKEISVWIINGLTFCIALPPRKLQNLRKSIKTDL